MIAQIRLLLSVVVGANALFLLDHAEEPSSPIRSVDAAVVLAGAGEDWWQAVTTQIAREEYAASAGAEGLQAPNRAHNLRTRFHKRGIEIGPRVLEAKDAWRSGWEMAWFGRPGARRAVGGATPEAAGSRVTYRRAAFDEWYDNSPNGLEQGFTVHDRPAGTGPLCLTGRIVGSLRAEMSSEEGAVDLLDEHGARVMRYAELKVWDAEGSAVASHLELDGAELAILVEDEGAAYPLTVDPLMTSPAWTVESNQVGAALGISVATAGDVNGDGFSDVIVGAHQYDNGHSNEGRAYVYHGSPTGLSTTPAWTAESNQSEAFFGSGVSTAGDVNGDGFSDVIVGAEQYDNVPADEGRAYVYHGSASGLATSHAWTAESNQAGSAFGGEVSAAGDVNGDGFSDVIVGARFFDSGQIDEGRAYVYHGSATGLASSAAWTRESNQEGGVFGNSVGTAGDVNGDGFSDVIVGAAGYDNLESGEGQAYVYHGAAAGLALAPAWTAEANQDNASFGFSVATAGDVNGDGFSDVVVGASNYDNGHSNEGRASVYHGAAAGLAAAPAWTAESNQVDARFGNAVATAGDVNGDGFADVIIGARSFDNGETDEGRAFVYQGSASGLTTAATWTAESNQGFGELGISVATAGDVNGDGFSDVIVGAHLSDNGQADEGRAHVYHGAAAGLATSAAWTAESNQDNAFLGQSVAAAGDVNGDGFSDVIVGAYLYDNGQTNEGRAFVYHGSAAGLVPTAAWTAESNQAESRFGASVATAGDVNGDGYADVIVGAYFYDNGQNDEGRAFVYHGSPAGLASAAAWTAESNQAVALFGGSAATAGDVNGDGYADVIVGSDSYTNEELGEGRAFVYHGSSTGLAVTPAWTAEPDQASAQFGISVATAGDVNGDGFSDVIVGADAYSDPELDEGWAFVYHGSSDGLATSPAWFAEGNLQEVGFGNSVGTAGDVNGDGYSDVVVGASVYDNGHDAEGRAYVYHGTAAGLNTTPAWTAEANQINARFGGEVATAGDVNGDGFSDVIVGAHGFDNGHTSEGRAFVYHGSAAGLAASPAWTGESNQDGALFGGSVAGAGDVNGDGFGDVIVGASSYVNGQMGEGRAFFYYGNGGPGRRMQLRQQRIDMTPLAPLGRSDSETQFRIAATMLSVFGRTRLQMEHEAKPRGELLDGLNTTPGGFNDTGNDGQVNFGRVVSGLDPGTQYHWRVRAKYDMVKTPFQRNGPWVHVPTNGWNETDLRTAGTVAGIAMAEAPRAAQLLAAPRPNPFASSTEIAYTLPVSGRVRLSVYDVTGRELAVLVDGVETKGQKSMTWNGRGGRANKSLPAGVYFLRLVFAGQMETRKLVLAP